MLNAARMYESTRSLIRRHVLDMRRMVPGDEYEKMASRTA